MMTQRQLPDSQRLKKNKKERTEQTHERLHSTGENRLYRISPNKPLNKKSNHLQLRRKRNQNEDYIIKNVQISTKNYKICKKEKKKTEKCDP